MSKSVNVFLNRHFALIVALMIGAMAGFLMLFMPEWRFASLVDLLGIDRLIPGAQPPFGGTARKAAAVVAGLVGLVAGWPLVIMFERMMGKKTKVKTKIRPRSKSTVVAPAAPKVSAADAHPDAPPRRPIFAETELGAPLMSEEALSIDGELVLNPRDQALDVLPVEVGPLPSILVAPLQQAAAVQPAEPFVSAVQNREDIAPAVSQKTVEPEDHSIDAMITRLDSALRGRTVRHKANPEASAGIPGDIVSLRQALRSFGDAA